MNRSLSSATMLAIALGLPLAVGVQSDFLGRAKAAPVAPPVPPPLDYERFDNTKPVVKPSKPMPVAPTKPIKSCVLDAQTLLEAETAALAASLGAGTPAFNEAYAKRKSQLLSDAALAAAGCHVDK